MVRSRLMCGLLGALLVTGTAAQGAIVLDQKQTEMDATSGFLDGYLDAAQTFTVGYSGVLSGISVYLADQYPITLKLLQTANGLPTFSVIASAVAIPPQLPSGRGGLTLFDFTSSNISVSAGDILAFQPSTSSSDGEVIGYEIIALSCQIGLPCNRDDPYRGGEAFISQPAQGLTPWQPFSASPNYQYVDMTFQTFVDVPEPATMALLGFGLVGTLSLRRWSRR